MDALIAEFPRFVSGFLGTLRLCLFAGIGALVLGTLLAAFRVSPVPPLRLVGTAWVTVFRNSPLVVVLFLFAFGLPQVGVRFPTFGGNAFFWPGVAGLAAYTAAFVCEAVRSGINSVPPGRPRRPARSGSPSSRPWAPSCCRRRCAPSSRRWAACSSP